MEKLPVIDYIIIINNILHFYNLAVMSEFL